MKNKEWLENKIIKDMMTNSGNPNMTSYEQGRVAGLNDSLKLIGQLEEPEQEKVVVPQFVANEIERYDNMLDMLSGEYFNSSFEEIDDDGLLIWIDENLETFARAWINGCSVEKEKLYRVELIRGKYLIYNHKNNQLHNQELDAYVGDYEQREFTEQEIKAIDERYLAFKVEVTE